jgi:hypothetical protein
MSYPRKPVPLEDVSDEAIETHLSRLLEDDSLGDFIILEGVVPSGPGPYI